MNPSARVESIESLKAFRVALCQFADVIRTGLSEAEAHVRSTAIWLEQERYPYWKHELRKRQTQFVRAKLALEQKQRQTSPLGGRYSHVDERKALATAKRRFEEAEQKFANVRRWIRQLEKETFDYKGVVQQLGQAVELEVPNGVARLDRMIEALGAYLSLAAPTDERVTTDAPGPDRLDSEAGPGSVAPETPETPETPDET